MKDDLEIACPKCDWHPDGGEYWQCDCGHTWNTFDTAGKCPSCKKQHIYTSCIPYQGGCSSASPHLDWYKNLDDILEKALDEVNEEITIFLRSLTSSVVDEKSYL